MGDGKQKVGGEEKKHSEFAISVSVFSYPLDRGDIR